MILFSKANFTQKKKNKKKNKKKELYTGFFAFFLTQLVTFLPCLESIF